jgi:hypothetical protein
MLSEYMIPSLVKDSTFDSMFSIKILGSSNNKSRCRKLVKVAAPPSVFSLCRHQMDWYIPVQIWHALHSCVSCSTATLSPRFFCSLARRCGAFAQENRLSYTINHQILIATPGLFTILKVNLLPTEVATHVLAAVRCTLRLEPRLPPLWPA